MDNRTVIQGYGTYSLLSVDPNYAQSLEPKRVVGPKPGQDLVRFNAGCLYILPTSKNPDAARRVLMEFTSPENSA